MQEGKRQKQVGAVIEKELNDIFRRLGLAMVDGGMVSISAVRITPDLLEARVYLSFYKVEQPAKLLKHIEDRSWEIRKELTARVRHQLRIMPQLKFFLDDTLEYVDRMEKLFKEIKTEEEKKSGKDSR